MDNNQTIDKLQKKYGITVSDDSFIDPLTGKNQTRYKMYSADGCTWAKGLTLQGLREECSKWEKELINIKENIIKYYVIEDLNEAPYKLHNFEHLTDAMNKFNSLPQSSKTAIGCFKELGAVDLVHRINGIPVKITDAYYLNNFSSDNTVIKDIKTLENFFNIKFQLCSGIHPRKRVIIPLENLDSNDSYMNDKILFIPPSRGSKSFLASINEIFEESKGWIDIMDFVNDHKIDDDVYVPVVSKINANYEEIETGYVGQADMSPMCFKNMIVKSKEHFHYIANKSLDSKINAALKDIDASPKNNLTKDDIER